MGRVDIIQSIIREIVEMIEAILFLVLTVNVSLPLLGLRYYLVMKKRKRKMRYEFLDLVQVKGFGHRSNFRGVILEGNRHLEGDSYAVQWPRTVTIIDDDSLEDYGR